MPNTGVPHMRWLSYLLASLLLRRPLNDARSSKKTVASGGRVNILPSPSFPTSANSSSSSSSATSLCSSSDSGIVSYLEYIPEEVFAYFMIFLGPDLPKLALTSKFYQSLMQKIATSQISAFNPKLLHDSLSFNLALYGCFLAGFKASFPELSEPEVLLEDVVELAYWTSLLDGSQDLKRGACLLIDIAGIESGDHGIFLNMTFEDIQPGLICAKRYLRKSLFNTANFLLKNGKISAVEYCDHAQGLKDGKVRGRCLSTILQGCEEPLELLESSFSCELALMILKRDPALRQEILELAALEISQSKPAPEALLELARELAFDPILLAHVLESTKSRDWVRRLLEAATEEQIAAVGGFWPQFKALAGLETFNEEEFAVRFTPSIELDYFMLKMNLCDGPQHLEAFKYLISRPEVDFSSPDTWEFNALRMCAKSRVPEFMELFLRHARSFPPIWMDGLSVADFQWLPPRIVELLAPRLTRLTDFLAFKDKSSWSHLAAHFDRLDISEPLSVRYSDYFRAPELSAVMPAYLQGVIEWPFLHLTVVTKNLAAFRAALSHPQFRQEMLHEWVAGLSLDDLFKRLVQADPRSLSISEMIEGSHESRKQYCESQTAIKA